MNSMQNSIWFLRRNAPRGLIENAVRVRQKATVGILITPGDIIISCLFSIMHSLDTTYKEK